MIRYFERVPSAAIQRDDEGMYAYGLYKLITLSDGNRSPVKTKRAVLHRVAFVKDGEAYLSLGRAADKKGVTTNLPFPVSFERID